MGSSDCCQEVTLHMFSTAAVALRTVGVNSPDEGEKSDNKCKKRKEKDKNMETRCWLKAGGPCGYYYSEGYEYQRATSKGLPAYREADTGGKKQLKAGFPRQEQQLPTRPSSQHASSACSLSNLQSKTHNTTSQRLTEDTILKS